MHHCHHDWDLVRKAVCSAYFQNAGRMKTVAEYTNMRNGMPCHLHPSSALRRGSAARSLSFAESSPPSPPTPPTVLRDQVSCEG